MKKLKQRPRIYLRKIQPFQKALASQETMTWLWMGANPAGKDWSLGAVELFSLEEAIQHYRLKLRRSGLPEARRG